MPEGFDNLLHRAEALALADAESDAFTRALIKQMLHTAHRLLIPDGSKKAVEPSAPIDLLFVVEIARAMAQSREILERFLKGDLTDDFGDPL